LKKDRLRQNFSDLCHLTASTTCWRIISSLYCS